MRIVPGVPKKPAENANSAASARDPQLWIWGAIALGYALLFFATSLPSIAGALGERWPRARFAQFLLVPETLLDQWVGVEFLPGAVVDRLPILGATLVMLLVAWSVGSLLLARFPCGLHRRLEQAVFAIAIGLSVMSSYTLALGLAGLLHRAWFLGPALLVVGTAIYCQVRRPRTPAPRGDSPGANLWLWLAAPLAAFIVLGAMLPPVEFDAREYHLQAPKEFYQRGRVELLPHNVYANMALGSEMHTLAAMTALDDWERGALVGKTMQAAFAILTALALVAAGSRWYSTSAGSLAALVWLSTPWVALVGMAGLVEPTAACYTLLTFHAALALSPQPENETGDSRAPLLAGSAVDRPEASFALVGFLAGSAVATKYPAALFVLAPSLCYVLWIARGQRVRAGILFLAAATLACGLWFAKNWYFAGNPTYPLLYDLFGGETLNAERNAQWSAAHGPPGFGLALAARSLAEVFWRSEWLGLAAWPLALWGAIVVRRRSTGLALAYVAFYLSCWWLFTHRIDRFWLPMLPVLALVAGSVDLWATTAPRRWMLRVFMIVATLYALLVSASPLMIDNRYLAPLAELRRDPIRVGEWRLWLNQHTPPGECVLAVGDAQVFDLEPPVRYNTVFDESVFEQAVRAKDGKLLPSEVIRARLNDVAFVYVDWLEIARYRSPGNYGFSPFVTPELFDELVARGVLSPVKEFAEGGVRIYRVRRANQD